MLPVRVVIGAIHGATLILKFSLRPHIHVRPSSPDRAMLGLVATPRPARTPRPYRTRVNPAAPAKQPGPRGAALFCWWRRRELNPRPLALGSRLYMLRVRLLI